MNPAGVRVQFDSQPKERKRVKLLSLGRKDDNASKARLANVRKEIDDLKDKLLNVCKRMNIVNVYKKMCAKGCDKNVKQERKALEIYGRDLVEEAGKLDPVVGRDEEIIKVSSILSQSNNIVLIGETGVGKTAVVKGLAQMIGKGNVPCLAEVKLIALDTRALVSGAEWIGILIGRLNAVLKEVEDAKGKVILFIDEFHLVLDAVIFLKPMFDRGEIRCIGETTPDEYRKYVEKDTALERRFQQVYVSEPSVSDTISILRGLQEKYEVRHGVRIQDRSIVVAAELSSQYISGRHLPDKAIDLVDEACARVKFQLHSQPEEIAILNRKRMQLEVQLYSLEKRDDKDSKARLVDVRKELDNLGDKLEHLKMKFSKEKERIDEIRRLKQIREELVLSLEEADSRYDLARDSDLRYGAIDKVENAIKQLECSTDGENLMLTDSVGPNQIAEVVSRWTGIRVTWLGQNDKERLIGLGDRLHNIVVGQDQAINAVVRSIAGFGRPRYPIGSFLFLGPTGVGKTKLAEALAEQLFDDENQLVTMYMSQYMEQHSCSSLIGAAPGFVERLTEVVRRRPNSVLLFEEVEKAHISVINKLVYILEDGSLTDGQGRTVDFTNTIIITTSKLGAEHLLSGLSEKCTMQVACDRVMQEVRNHFRPNFWYQLDEVVAFNPLSHEQSRKVARLQIKDVANRLAEKGIALAVTDATLDYIIAESYDPVYGARPITRWIEIKVVSELSRMLIWEEIDENTTVFVDAGPNGSGLVYRVENNDENTTVFVDAGPNGSGLVYRVENNEEIVNAETEVKSDILIQTSKLGAERLPSGLSGKCTKQVARDRVMQEVRNYFRPNFLYELDEDVVFDPLSLEPLRKVARLQINDVANRLAKKGIALAVTDAALDYVLAESYDPVYGARPIRRWLEKKVVTELSRMLIREEIDENTTVYIDAGPNGSGLVYRVENNEEIVNAETGVKSDILIQIAN